MVKASFKSFTLLRVLWFHLYIVPNRVQLVSFPGSGDITLFKSITMLCKIDNILWNIASFMLDVTNIPYNIVSLHNTFINLNNVTDLVSWLKLINLVSFASNEIKYMYSINIKIK